MFEDLYDDYNSKKARAADKNTRAAIINNTDFNEYLESLKLEGNFEYTNIFRRLIRIFYDDKKLDKLISGGSIPDEIVESVTGLVLFLCTSMAQASEDVICSQRELRNIKMDLFLHSSECTEC